MRRATAVLLAGALALAACSSGGSDSGSSATSAPKAAKPDDSLKLNQIQVIGTHNSFHQATNGKEHALLAALDAEQAKEREYTHPALPTQLRHERARQIELDVFADAKGGLYANPVLRGEAGLGSYADEEPSITKPGTKVLHEQDVDYRSVCPLFTDCLEAVKEWSDHHPGHVPVLISIQFKDGPLIFPVDGQAVPEKWDPAAMAALDREILSVFDRDDIVTPADVQGDHATLEEAVLAGDWPTLGESRGKVMFNILNGQPYNSTYYGNHRDHQASRLLFLNADPGTPEAAIMGVDDPTEGGDRIRELVEKGYLVRTRADVPNEQARTGDTAMRDAALASGAQFVSTDYPRPGEARDQYGDGTDYVAQLPDGLAARCNPVTAPETCQDGAVEP